MFTRCRLSVTLGLEANRVYSELIHGSRWLHFHIINRTMFHRHFASEI